MNQDVSTGTTTPTTLQCMSVWSGNDLCNKRLSVTGMDVHVCSQPSCGENEGGDIYSVSMCACAAISRYILADVSGHGASIAPVTQRLRKLMYKHINHPNQTRAAQALNQEFSVLAKMNLFATALLLTYLPETDHLIICNAGHPPPLWYRASLGVWQPIKHETMTTVPGMDLPLGVLPGTLYHQSAVMLEPDDLVVLFSDGLMENPNAQGERLGWEGFRALVATLDPDPHTLGEAVLQATSSPHQEADDDRTIVVLKHNASDPPSQTIGEKVSAMTRMVRVKASLLLEELGTKVRGVPN